MSVCQFPSLSPELYEQRKCPKALSPAPFSASPLPDLPLPPAAVNLSMGGKLNCRRQSVTLSFVTTFLRRGHHVEECCLDYWKKTQNDFFCVRRTVHTSFTAANTGFAFGQFFLGFFCQRCCSGKITIRNDSIACVGTALPRQPSPRPQQQPPPVCQHRPLPDPPGQTRSQPHNGLPPPPLRPQPRLQPLSPQPLPPPRRARATLWASLCPRTRLLVCFPKFGTFVRKQPIFSDSCRNI